MKNTTRGRLAGLAVSAALLALTPARAADWVPIKGKVRLADGTPICAMVLANGQYVFSCGGDGAYSLNVPLDNKGQVTLFAFADGFAPFRVSAGPKRLPSTVRTRTADRRSPRIAITRGAKCAANNWVRIRGEIESFGGDPLCAMVLANGQHMFTCGANNGRYDLTVPADENGHVTVFGFADGFQPYSDTFIAPNCDSSAPGNHFSLVGDNDTGIYLSTGRGSIYVWDMAENVVTLVAETGLPLSDIAIAPDGRLFGITGDTLYRIDPQTGQTARVGLLEGEEELYFGVYALTGANGFDISPAGVGRITSGNNSIVTFVDLRTGGVSWPGPLYQHVLGQGQTSAGDLWYTSATRFSLTTSSYTLVNAAPSTITTPGIEGDGEGVASSEFIGGRVDGLVESPGGGAGIKKGELIGFVGQTAYALPGITRGPGLATLRLDGAVTGAAARR